MDQQTKSQSPHIDAYVEAFIECRDRLRVLKENYETACAPLHDLQERLSGKLREFMDTHQVQNLKTKHGTCYTSTRWNASLADPDAFMKFVIANQQFDLLDRRANATAVKAYVQEHSQLPPGCNLHGIQQVGVRKA